MKQLDSAKFVANHWTLVYSIPKNVPLKCKKNRLIAPRSRVAVAGRWWGGGRAGGRVLGSLVTAPDTEEARAQPGRQPPGGSCTVHSLTLDVSGALSLHTLIS